MGPCILLVYQYELNKYTWQKLRGFSSNENWQFMFKKKETVNISEGFGERNSLMEMSLILRLRMKKLTSTEIAIFSDPEIQRQKENCRDTETNNRRELIQIVL